MNLVLHLSLVLFLLILVAWRVCEASVGAIAVLVRAQSSPLKYESNLILRNKAIQRYLYWNATANSRLELVFFHEGNLPVAHQQYIRDATPELPMQFIDVGEVFREYKNVNISICPKVLLISQMFSPGYHSMCHFWFLRFQRYLTAYDWMLRIDDDCILARPIRRHLQRLSPAVHFASCLWVDLSNGTTDAIRPVNEGIVVTGMRNLTVKYARQHNLYEDIHSWHAPYTNVMYINLHWLRNNTIVQGFMQTVEDSQCIYSNRWGDLPLWGAAIHLAKEPRYHLKVPYYHGSHNLLVNGSHTKSLTDIV